MKWLAGIPPLPAFGAGLILGLVVTVFSDSFMRRALASSPPGRKGTLNQKMVRAFLLKYALDVVALFLVYRNVTMMLGVAAGLSVSVFLQVKRAKTQERG